MRPRLIRLVKGPVFWPLFALEVGYSKSGATLERDARFWLSEGGSAVKYSSTLDLEHNSTSLTTWEFPPPNSGENGVTAEMAVRRFGGAWEHHPQILRGDQHCCWAYAGSWNYTPGAYNLLRCETSGYVNMRSHRNLAIDTDLFDIGFTDLVPWWRITACHV